MLFHEKSEYSDNKVSQQFTKGYISLNSGSLLESKEVDNKVYE